jgi:hypothetical protein
MNDDFAVRRARQDNINFRPDYKPAENLKVDENINDLGGVDFDKFNKKNKKNKKRLVQASMD